MILNSRERTRKMSHVELKNKLQQCGIVGAGGAGFPTYAKLAPGADTLVLNCAECEPLLYTDYMLMQEHLGKIAEGAAMLLREANIARAVSTSPSRITDICSGLSIFMDITPLL